jgi:hypothetical protein
MPVKLGWPFLYKNADLLSQTTHDIYFPEGQVEIKAHVRLFIFVKY